MTSPMTSQPELTAPQKAALTRFAKMRVGAAFMEQGMGKSRVAVELANLRRERIDAVLWVCPFSVKGTVEAECAKWGLEVPLKVVGYETISQSDGTYLELLDWVKSRRVMVVADESSFIKNVKSKRTERMSTLRRHCPYALALNGTPLTRDLWDVKTQMDWLDPRIINATSRQYKRRYFVEHSRTVWTNGCEEKRYWYTTYTANITHLRSLLEPYIIEGRLDFDRQETSFTRRAPLSPDSSELYDKTRDDFFAEHEDFGSADTLEVYKLLGALQRVVALDPSRHKAIAGYISGRCIVFCQFIEELRGIAGHLGEHLVITGETSLVERERILAQFRVGDLPLLMTYGVGSFGLNLQDACVMHLASEGYDYGKTEQARSRIRRMGQTKDVTYYRYGSGTGIEDLVQQNLTEKDLLASIVRRKFSL